MNWGWCAFSVWIGFVVFVLIYTSLTYGDQKTTTYTCTQTKSAAYECEESS